MIVARHFSVYELNGRPQCAKAARKTTAGAEFLAFLSCYVCAGDGDLSSYSETTS